MKTSKLFSHIIILLIIGGTSNITFAQFQNNGGNLYTNKDVGIGTSSPNRNLQISSDDNVAFELDYNPILGNGTFGMRISSSSKSWDIGVANDRSATYDFMLKPATASTPYFVINEFGDVGIGTTSPSRTLHIRETAKNVLLELESSHYGGSKMRFASTYSNGRSWDIGSTSGKFIIRDASSSLDRLIIDKNGRVGIGTNSPIRPFHVKTSWGEVMILESSNAVGSRILFTATAQDGRNWEIGATAQGATNEGGGNRFMIRDQAANKARLIINKFGNVGIGTTSPNYKLDVCGEIRAKEILVQSGWCDYVFDPDYKMPSLEDEAKNIAEKGHLLGFESEEDMDSKIELADISKKQQVKIEEMMLHLIQLKNEIEEIKQENTALRTLLKEHNNE